MNATMSRLSTVLFVATVCAASAHAQYRCDSSPVGIDRRACEAADQGPDALRRFVERMDRKMVNLLFSDYVDAKTAQRWEAKQRQQDAQKVASSTSR